MSLLPNDPLAPLAPETTVPVAMRVLEPLLRMRLMALYRWMRGVDDIADDPLMAGIDKRDKLRAIRQAIEEENDHALPSWARGLGAIMRRKECSFRHALDVLIALEEDTDHRPMRDYDALLAYAQLAAVPIGRMALEIADEKTADLMAADALSLALQLLNIVRDSGKDFLVLERVYLPSDWRLQAGMDVEDLTLSYSTPRVRAVHGRLLERVRSLLVAAHPLPDSIRNRRLRIVLRAMISAAHRLERALRTRDPLAQRVTLSPLVQASCVWQAVLDEFIPSRSARRDENA